MPLDQLLKHAAVDFYMTFLTSYCVNFVSMSHEHAVGFNVFNAWIHFLSVLTRYVWKFFSHSVCKA